MSIGISKLFEDAESFVDHHRPIPAVMALEKAKEYINIPDRRAWASYNLGAIHWNYLGNGLAARKEFLASIDDFDTYGYEKRPQFKTIHANAVENAMLCALSFEEFETFAERLHKLAPGVPILKGLLPEVRDLRERGMAWSDQMFSIACSYYNRNDPRQDPGRYGPAKSTYHLMLAHRHKLRLSREDWRMAIFEFCALSMRIATDCKKARGGDNDPHSPEEFLPILTDAIPLAEEYLKINSGDDQVQKACNGMNQIVTNYRSYWKTNDVPKQGCLPTLIVLSLLVSLIVYLLK